MTDCSSNTRTETSLSEKIKEAAGHTLIYGLGAACQTLVGFILIPLYTRYYTPEIYGVLSLVVLCGTLAGAVFYLGASSALSRSYYDYSDVIERKKVVSTSLLLTLSGAFVQVLLGFLLRERLSSLLFGSTKYALHINIALVSSAISFTNGLLYLLLRFERKSKQVIFINLLTLVSGASLILWLLVVSKLGVMAPILGDAINQLLTFGLLCYFTRKAFVWGYSRLEIRVQLHYGIPTLVSGLLLYLLSSTDRLLINKWLSLREVGIYALGCKIGMAIQPLYIIPFSQIWAPMRMEYREDRNAQQLYRVIFTYYFACGLFLAVVASLFARDILILFAGRPEYRIAYQIVPIVMTAYLVYGTINIVDFGVALFRKPIYHVYNLVRHCYSTWVSIGYWCRDTAIEVPPRSYWSPSVPRDAGVLRIAEIASDSIRRLATPGTRGLRFATVLIGAGTDGRCRVAFRGVQGMPAWRDGGWVYLARVEFGREENTDVARPGRSSCDGSLTPHSHAGLRPAGDQRASRSPIVGSV